MTEENFNNDTEDSPESGVQETLDALNNDSDMSFVAPETKKPMNKTSLVLFLIVALGGGGLYLMHLKTSPASASAATTSAANQTINQFLNSGPNNIRLMEETLRNTEKVVQKFSNPNVKQVPLSGLQTNPFRVTSGNGDDQDDPVAKRKLAEQRVAVVKSFQSLQLQTIMYGEKNRSCLINNTLFHEGQQVSGFTIEKITSDCVYVKQADWRFELKMQR